MRKRRWFIAGGLIVLAGVALLVFSSDVAWWFDLLLSPEDGNYRMRPVSGHAEYARLHIAFSPADVRQGKIRIGRQRFYALLARKETAANPFDKLSRLYVMTAEGRDTQQDWWGANEISSFRLVDGSFYTISATPTGETLMVRLYRGDLGVLRIAPGNRQINDVWIRGAFRSETAIVPVGQLSTEPWDKHPAGHTFPPPSHLHPVAECEVPVGDYCAHGLFIRYGRLRMFLSDNYHADGKRMGAPRDQAGGIKPVCGIKIRKDRPYVFDFPNKPEVMFASPAKEQTFHGGDEIKVYAVLIDPVLSTMIRQLDDTSRKEIVKTDPGGPRERSYSVDLSLAPIVVVSDSSGKTVSEGKMPFG